MFLHFLPYDAKFLTRSREPFEAAAGGEHVFVVTTRCPDQGLPAWAIRPRSRNELRAVVDAHKWKGIITHGQVVVRWLDPRIFQSVRKAWYVWGAEAYSAWEPLRRNLFFPATQQLARQCPRGRRPSWLKEFVRSLSGRSRQLQRAASSFDYCVTLFHEECELLRKAGLIGGTRHWWGSIGWLGQLVSDTGPPLELGNAIQIGNSASYTNNHLEAFRKLRRVVSDNREIVVPLSYGDASYAERICAEGRAVFGDAFRPIRKFVELHEYNALMQQCGIVVMHHRRQQAIGNIIAALWRGARLYLNDTPVFHGLTRLGFRVFHIDRDLTPAHRNSLEPLNEADARWNRVLLQDLLSRERVVAANAELLDRLASGRSAQSLHEAPRRRLSA